MNVSFLPDAESTVAQVDVRGPRFGAWVTTVVLAVALSGQPADGWWPSRRPSSPSAPFAGLRYAPYGVLFRLARRAPARARCASASPRRRRASPNWSACCSPSSAPRATCSGRRSRRRRHRPGAGGGPAQRGHRLLPGLRALPDRPAGAAGPRLTQPPPPDPPTEEPPHEPHRRARRRRLGRGPPGQPGLVFVEVDEDISAYDGGHLEGAVRLDWKTDLQDPRPVTSSTATTSRLLSRQGHQQRRHRRALRRQQQLVRRLRLLVLQALRPPRRQADRRRAQEVGARRPRAVQGRRRAPRDVVPGPGARPVDPRLPRRGRRLDRQKNLVDVRSPDEFSGKIIAPAHLPQEQSQTRRPHPDRDQHPVEQGGQRRRHVPVRRGARAALRRAGLRRRQGRPSRTAASASARATPGSCCTSCSASPTSRTTTARGPSTAPSSASRSRRRADMCGAPNQGGTLPGSTSTRRRSSRVRSGTTARRWRGVRPAARRDRRVHRRGGDQPRGRVPVLRRAREVDPPLAVPDRQGRAPRRRRRRPERDDARHRRKDPLDPTARTLGVASRGGRAGAAASAACGRPVRDRLQPDQCGQLADDPVEEPVGVVDRADEVAEQLEADQSRRAGSRPASARADASPAAGRAPRTAAASSASTGRSARRGSRRRAATPARAASRSDAAEDDRRPGRRRRRCPRGARSRAPASRRAARTRADGASAQPRTARQTASQRPGVARGRGVVGRLGRVAEGVVAVDDQRGEQVVAAREVAVDRRGDHAELPGDRAQREAGGAALGELARGPRP